MDASPLASVLGKDVGDFPSLRLRCEGGAGCVESLTKLAAWTLIVSNPGRKVVALADYNGNCGALADNIIGGGDIIYVEGEGPNSKNWNYHMVALIDGIIHDGWHPEPLPLPAWLVSMFGEHDVIVSLNGDDIYCGPANEFQDESALALP